MDTSKKIGRYEILEELGHGAMGTVYRAKDPAMDRVVAVKTIISLALAGDQGSEFRERFYREARAAGGLAHPGIVPVFDVGEHEGLPFLVMEFISGRTLADAVRKGERLTIDRVCEFGQKIADALGYAHQRGVVHRDIKPANILLTSKEAYGIERPKITDFGVAKLAAGHTTLTGQILGTPAYMPPEQFTGAPIDGRADIFSLGVMLYWMATGEQPFPGESMTAVSYKVVHTDPVPPRRLNPSVPAKLESLILRCLAKSPDERYQTGEEVARDLGELRTASTLTGSQSAAAQTPAGGVDPDKTLIEPAPQIRIAAATAKRQPAPPTAQTRKSNTLVLAVAAAVAIGGIGAGSWYALRNRAKVSVSEAPPTAVTNETQPAPASAPIAPAVPVTATPPVAKAGASAPQNQEAKAAPVNAPQPPKVKVPPHELAALDFNPKSLDSKTNARLKIEANEIPANVDFTVELNGKLYLRRSAEGNKAEFDDWYVPPGIHEFRVTAMSNGVQKVSNTVSTEFMPKKRHTLKIELRTQGRPPGSGVPQGLYPDTQIVLTLK